MRQFRLGVTALLAVYGLVLLASADSWSFIDNVNLPVHETGHLLFAPFGDTMQLLGGTLLQLLFPLVFAGYFTLQRDEHAASVAVWWVGQNCLNIARYMADAQPMDLPLVGGGEHDWNILFAQWNVLGQSLQYAQLTRGFGVLVMLVACVWGGFEALNRTPRAPASQRRYNHGRRS